MHFVCEYMCVCVCVGNVHMCLANKLEEQTLGSVSLIKEPDTTPHFLFPICLPTNRDIVTLADI